MEEVSLCCCCCVSRDATSTQLTHREDGGDPCVRCLETGAFVHNLSPGRSELFVVIVVTGRLSGLSNHQRVGGSKPSPSIAVCRQPALPPVNVSECWVVGGQRGCLHVNQSQGGGGQWCGGGIGLRAGQLYVTLPPFKVPNYCTTTKKRAYQYVFILTQC